MSAGPGGTSPYTRDTMETGTLGERRQVEVEVDDLYAEAKQTLSQSANRLHELTERLREAYGEELDKWQEQSGLEGRDAGADGQDAGRAGRARRLLSRMEVVTSELEEDWRFLERGLAAESMAGRSAADASTFSEPLRDDTAMRIFDALEEERTLLAEELHDGPAQALSNATFQAQIVDRALRHDPALAAVELETLRLNLAREMKRMRGFIHQLRPAVNEAGGLKTGITDAAQLLASEAGMDVQVDLAAPEEALAPPQRVAVLRVALEAMRNARKHSGASHLLVTTRVEPAQPPAGSSWLLEVTDDGHGFSMDEVLDQSSRRHFGLRFMRERARLIGARLEIISNATWRARRSAWRSIQGRGVEGDGDELPRSGSPPWRPGSTQSGRHGEDRARRRSRPVPRRHAPDPRTRGRLRGRRRGRGRPRRLRSSRSSTPGHRPARPVDRRPGGIETTQRIKREVPSDRDHRAGRGRG